jgi:hydroxymethylglutaryl-CoA reductase
MFPAIGGGTLSQESRRGAQNLQLGQATVYRTAATSVVAVNATTMTAAAAAGIINGERVLVGRLIHRDPPDIQR